MSKVNEATQNTNLDDDDNDFLNEDQTLLLPRIKTLKNKADRLGIKYSPNIGEDTLAKKIEDYLLGSQGLLDEENESSVEINKAMPAMTEQERRILARRNANLLVRVNIHPNDPMRQQLQGEYVVTGNLEVGTITKFIPFGTTRGYMVPRIILDILRDRTFTHFQYRKDQYGNSIAYPVQRAAYSITELPQLTEKELDVIAARQKAQLDWESEQDNMGQ